MTLCGIPPIMVPCCCCGTPSQVNEITNTNKVDKFSYKVDTNNHSLRSIPRSREGSGRRRGKSASRNTVGNVSGGSANIARPHSRSKRVARTRGCNIRCSRSSRGSSICIRCSRRCCSVGWCNTSGISCRISGGIGICKIGGRGIVSSGRGGGISARS